MRFACLFARAVQCQRLNFNHNKNVTLHSIYDISVRVGCFYDEIQRNTKMIPLWTERKRDRRTSITTTEEKREKKTEIRRKRKGYGLQLHFLAAYDVVHVKRYNVSDNDNAALTTQTHTILTMLMMWWWRWTIVNTTAHFLGSLERKKQKKIIMRNLTWSKSWIGCVWMCAYMFR